MKKNFLIKTAAVFLAVMMLLSGCGGSQPVEIPLSSQYIYNSLNEKEKNAFSKLYSGVTNYKHSVNIGNMRQTEFETFINKFYCCGSEFFYMQNGIKYYVNGDGYVAKCTFNYDYYEDATKSMQEQLEKKADEILAGIPEGSSDADKLKYINDYLVSNTTYDMEAMDCDNVYGALIKHKTHCQGYSKSVCYLCDKLGIESMLVTGDAGGPHMWNMVKLDGKWYNLDVTWNDPDFGGRSLTYFFLISDSTISQTHVKENYVKYPDAPSDYDYRG